MKKELVAECKNVEQNSLYSAEAHHILAQSGKNKAIIFQVIPACITAVLATLVGIESVPNNLIWLAVVSAVVSAIANVINPLKEHYDHLYAAKSFVALKHDARTLYKAFGKSMSEGDFALQVKFLHDRYNDLIKVVPATDKNSFDAARERIAEGVHDD